ncbi:uncharacterized protein LOC127002302 [Eriocheir sinensis]|uniref:uncharacterized protein LOC127002302 n=1 Tax=Eriocheir sinensis TaxID=95602 RepID=UPI0021CAC007|nr:uncharacterized protein LOC127002302 [Eriocheir sinensis]
MSPPAAPGTDNTPTLHHPNTPTPRHPDSQTSRHPDTQTPRHSNTPTPRHSNTPTPRHPDTPTLQHPDTPTLQHPDSPTPRYPDTQTPRHPDTQTPQHPDTPTTRRGHSTQPRLSSHSLSGHLRAGETLLLGVSLGLGLHGVPTPTHRRPGAVARVPDASPPLPAQTAACCRALGTPAARLGGAPRRGPANSEAAVAAGSSPVCTPPGVIHGEGLGGFVF